MLFAPQSIILASLMGARRRRRLDSATDGNDLEVDPSGTSKDSRQRFARIDYLVLNTTSSAGNRNFTPSERCAMEQTHFMFL